MDPIRTLTATTVVLPVDNVDTDQIIPARFLKTTTRAGLGTKLFSDWRYDAAGAPRPDFVLNRPEAAGAQVLVAGDNFGCGSSREHAPWALADFGFRAVIATSIADIFRGNALKNGLLPIVVPAEVHRALVAKPGAEVTIDIDTRTLTVPGLAPVPFPLDAFSRHCLMNGVDELGFLLAEEMAITRHEARQRESFGETAE